MVITVVMIMVALLNAMFNDGANSGNNDDVSSLDVFSCTGRPWSGCQCWWC